MEASTAAGWLGQAQTGEKITCDATRHREGGGVGGGEGWSGPCTDGSWVGGMGTQVGELQGVCGSSGGGGETDSFAPLTLFLSDHFLVMMSVMIMMSDIVNHLITIIISLGLRSVEQLIRNRDLHVPQVVRKCSCVSRVALRRLGQIDVHKHGERRWKIRPPDPTQGRRDQTRSDQSTSPRSRSSQPTDSPPTPKTQPVVTRPDQISRPTKSIDQTDRPHVDQTNRLTSGPSPSQSFEALMPPNLVGCAVRA